MLLCSVPSSPPQNPPKAPIYVPLAALEAPLVVSGEGMMAQSYPVPVLVYLDP